MTYRKAHINPSLSYEVSGTTVLGNTNDQRCHVWTDALPAAISYHYATVIAYDLNQEKWFVMFSVKY